MNAKRRQKAPKARQEARRRDSKYQAKRNPMLQVRVPQSLYKSLKSAAEADNRTLADWLRLNLPRLIVEFPTSASEARAAIKAASGSYPIPSADAVDPVPSSSVPLTTREKGSSDV